jgi:hypothetical protein
LIPESVAIDDARDPVEADAARELRHLAVGGPVRCGRQGERYENDKGESAKRAAEHAEVVPVALRSMDSG